MHEIRVSPFQLIQWKHWIRMEIKRGSPCPHSSGRSVKAFAARRLGLSPRAKRELVLEHIETALEACRAADVRISERATVHTETPPTPQ